MLDNVIDINYYSVPQARTSNLRHHPVGLGIMGFQDALYKQHISYGSEDAVDFADKSMEAVVILQFKPPQIWQLSVEAIQVTRAHYGARYSSNRLIKKIS